MVGAVARGRDRYDTKQSSERIVVKAERCEEIGVLIVPRAGPEVADLLRFDVARLVRNFGERRMVEVGKVGGKVDEERSEAFTQYVEVCVSDETSVAMHIASSIFDNLPKIASTCNGTESIRCLRTDEELLSNTWSFPYLVQTAFCSCKISLANRGFCVIYRQACVRGELVSDHYLQNDRQTFKLFSLVHTYVVENEHSVVT